MIVTATGETDPTVVAAPALEQSLLICTVPVFDELHVTELSCSGPLEKVPMAMYCCELPGEIVAFAA